MSRIKLIKMIIAGNKKTAGRSGRFSEVPWFWMVGEIYGFTFIGVFVGVDGTRLGSSQLVANEFSKANGTTIQKKIHPVDVQFCYV